MPATQTVPSGLLMPGPELWCVELPEFNEADLAEVQRAFWAVKPCQMLQAWQTEVSPGFAPAAVRVGWRGNSLLVFAELTDEDIFSRATAPNQRLWELGDAFEIYLRPDQETTYVQFDIAPNNQRTQLRIPSAEALRRAQTANEFAGLSIPGSLFRSTTWLDAETQQWFVYAAIPATSVSGQTGTLAGSQWRFSFSRYDYTRGELEPVISSTAPHARANFHRQQEWGVIHFAPARIA